MGCRLLGGNTAFLRTSCVAFVIAGCGPQSETDNAHHISDECGWQTSLRGDGTLYWNDEASLSAVSKDGTHPRSLDTAGKVYGQIRLDAQSIYFLRDGQVFRLQR